MYLAAPKLSVLVCRNLVSVECKDIGSATQPVAQSVPTSVVDLPEVARIVFQIDLVFVFEILDVVLASLYNLKF